MSSQQPSRASRSFLGVIRETVRSRSRSPLPAPKETQSTQPKGATKQQTQPMSQTPRPVYSKRASSSSTTASSSAMHRTSSQSSQGSYHRTEFDRMAYGRHSNDWLFTSQKKLKRQSTGSETQS